MRRQQHPWAASCGKQKQPQTPCVQTPTALFYPYVPLQPSSPQALLHPDLCVSHWPPQPVCLGRQQEGAGAELLSGSQVHDAASQPAPLPLQETGLEDHPFILQESPRHGYFTPTCHLQVSCSFKTLRMLCSPLGIANKSPITMHE